MNDSKSSVSYMNWPCALTTGSLAGGFLALILTAQGDLRWAAGLVAVCALLDSLDGLLARRLAKSSAFGAELDSLADVVSFGVVPALLLYVGVLHDIPFAGVAASAGFLLCAAWRLARFSLIADDREFVGLPTPPAAIIATGCAVWAPPSAVALVMTVMLCLLMVSDIPFPTLGILGRLFQPGRRTEEEPRAAVK